MGVLTISTMQLDFLLVSASPYKPTKVNLVSARTVFFAMISETDLNLTSADESHHSVIKILTRQLLLASSKSRLIENGLFAINAVRENREVSTAQREEQGGRILLTGWY